MPCEPEPVSVVHLITSLAVGGAQMHLYKTVTRFDPRLIRSTVVSLVPPGPVGGLLQEAGLPVHHLGMAKGRPHPAGLARLVALLRRLRPQVLQTYLYHADLLGLLAGRLAGVPRIFWNLRQSVMEFGRYRRTTAWTVRLSARLSRRVDLILVNSWAGADYHRRLGYDPERMLVVPNGFDLERFRPDPGAYREVRRDLGLAPDHLLVGMFARLDPQKDHATFLAAAARVAAAVPQVSFLLAGTGLTPEQPQVEALVRESALPPGRLFLLGERRDIPRLAAALDVFVLSSAFGEGCANAVGEAMAAGVPCVVTRVGDSPRLVGDTGLTVPPRNPEALARAVTRLLTLEAPQRRLLGEAARSRIARHFALNTIVARLTWLYTEAAPVGPAGLNPVA
ncbi:MAG: glycosyltransferase [Syntrophobacterales bacterium]|nr:glycosyltransferase [Syntrophobacterales bacterium]